MLSQIWFLQLLNQRCFMIQNPVYIPFKWVIIFGYSYHRPEKWEGNWKAVSVKSTVNMEISNCTKNKVVHINGFQYCAHTTNISNSAHNGMWHTPQIEHFVKKATFLSQNSQYKAKSSILLNPTLHIYPFYIYN